jgi:hypothetical protein
MRWKVAMMGVVVCLGAGALADDGYQLSRADKLPEGLSEKISAALDPQGATVSGGDGAVCTVWLAKPLSVKPKFKPTLTVKYGLTQGQLVGAMQVHSESYSDFRGQPVKPGVYTLRYGLQPEDGNHVGTSETSDFLLAIPAESDSDPGVLKVKPLFKQSAKATGSNHPAIFSLLPPEEKTAAPALVHDASKELWILQWTATGTEGISTPLRLVVLGQSEG